MAKEIWLGPLLGNNRTRLIERCAELVSKGETDSFLYLAASQPLLLLVTQGILDGQKNRCIWGELPVYLFRGFVQRLLTSSVDEQTGRFLTPRIPIDRDELPLKASLISQVLKRLLQAKKLKAIAPLAHRDGCINSIATIIGEIERAAKSPADLEQIIAERCHDSLAIQGNPESAENVRQIDFDREIALIYRIYTELLERHQLTEEDADQLRALSILNGELEGRPVNVPWLSHLKLLVLDGFFDFTPVQGQMLQRLIPLVPDIVVNLNHDERNPNIFRPFQETIDHLCAMAPFAIKRSQEAVATAVDLSHLRSKLFNPSVISTKELSPHEDAGSAHCNTAARVRYLECTNRATELKAIAKEVKRLVLQEGFTLADIAVVVRQREAYAELISRVMQEEQIPCNFEYRIEAAAIPAVRAALKLFAILEERASEPSRGARMADLADLIKSGYFRLSESKLEMLKADFDRLAEDPFFGLGKEGGPKEKPESRLGIGRWDVDALENVIAFVGAELRIGDWVARGKNLIERLPDATSTKELLNLDANDNSRDAEEPEQTEAVEIGDTQAKVTGKRPSRDVHPAAVVWTTLVIKDLAEQIMAVPLQGDPVLLQQELMKLFANLQFSPQVQYTGDSSDHELPRVIRSFQGLEALHRAFASALKSIKVVAGLEEDFNASHTTKLANYLEEARRSLGYQSALAKAAARNGLRVLEATDVRGLRFRAVFVAGLVEGGFPVRVSRDWIYPYEERERLKRYGLTLEDISPATLLKEEHYFYQAVCRATEYLFLSRPLTLDNDAETVASYYIDEVRRAIVPAQMDTIIIREDLDGKELHDCSLPKEMVISLVRQDERHRHRGDKSDLLPPPLLDRFLSLAQSQEYISDSALRRIAIERERVAATFGPYDGQITEKNLIDLLAARFGPEFVHSASGLSVYGNCPYRFFVQRVLKLEPRGEAALDLPAMDAGKLLHDILRRFFEGHRSQQLSKVDRNELIVELRAIADHVFDEHQRVVPPLNQQIWKIDREIRKILLEQVLLYELDIQENAASEGVVPAHFEIAFGLQSPAQDPISKDEPLELARSTLAGKETLKISGQIDRVDRAHDGSAIAYDYKLSTGYTKEDMKSGRSLQIPIYLEALEQLILPTHRVAGGGYYTIRGSGERRNKGLHRLNDLRYSGISNRASAVVSEKEWQQIRSEVIERIWQFLDGLRAGTFLVRPSQNEETCKFCVYSSVCRYDRHRIVRKLQHLNSAT